MEYNKQHAIKILERTPRAIYTMLEGIPQEWLLANEGKNTWSPKEIVAHLILGEKTDWIPRTQLILSEKPDKHFKPFDMSSHLEYAKKFAIKELLEEFTSLRVDNLNIFRQLDLNKGALNKTGIHSEFGEVTLRQHLSTWVTHDLGHIAQISRVMAKQYIKQVGPWTNYISILNK